MGLPGAWTVLLLRAVVVHPAGCSLPSPCCGQTAFAFGLCNALGTRDDIVFVAAFPTAHLLACLRIAGRVAASVARLATRWAGSPFAGRGSHPLDDEPNFIRLSPVSLLSDQPCLVALHNRIPGGTFTGMNTVSHDPVFDALAHIPRGEEDLPPEALPELDRRAADLASGRVVGIPHAEIQRGLDELRRTAG